MRKKPWIVLAVAVIVSAGILINREWIFDFLRGVTYIPEGEMVSIKEKLGLTGRGEFLFKASRPSLSGREEFNERCTMGSSEVAVLGCYTEGNIYVYDIKNEELTGIRELTTAHELLHAVWARMSEGEREELRGTLQEVYEKNRAVLKDDLDTYGEGEKLEELFVRAGTEVADLPEVLEKKYAEIFSDQDAVVGYYEGYIGVFRALEAEMEELRGVLNEKQTKIGQMMEEYEARAAQLNAAVEEFNRCAETAGCFMSEWVFNVRRRELVSEQEALMQMYEEINQLVSEYNGLVEKYNADAVRGGELNRIINSQMAPEEME